MWKVTKYASELTTYFLVGMAVYFYTENPWLGVLAMVIPATSIVSTHRDAFRKGMDTGADIVDNLYKEWLNAEVKRLEGQGKAQPEEQQDD